MEAENSHLRGQIGGIDTAAHELPDDLVLAGDPGEVPCCIAGRHPRGRLPEQLHMPLQLGQCLRHPMLMQQQGRHLRNVAITCRWTI